MKEEDQNFIKKYIKTYLTPDTYELCCDFNRKSKNHNDIKAVVTGGDAIFYYINDIDSITKDFDIKFVYSDFRDWKQYLTEIQAISNYPNTYDDNVASRLADSYNILAEERFNWTLEFCKKISDIDDNDFMENVIQNREFLEINEYSPLHNAAKAALKIINSKGDDRYLINRIVISFGVAEIFSNLKKQSEIEPKYQNIYNYLYNVNNYLQSRLSVIYTLVLENSRGKEISISEGLVDGVLFCPYSYEFPDIYKISQDYLLDMNEPQKDKFKNRIDYTFEVDDSIVTRNFSFIETKEHFCVISIGFLIWDTVRMANVTYSRALRKNKASRIEHHKKYAKKYSTILTGLFSKVRCIEPFTENLSRCEDGDDSFDIISQGALAELEDNIIF